MVKTYRCGWCGQPVDKDGNPLSIKSIEEVDKYLGFADQIPGNRCRNEHEQEYKVQVTREMALDAGYPEMEGMWINW